MRPGQREVIDSVMQGHDTGRYPDAALIARVMDALRAATDHDGAGPTLNELAERLSDTGRNKLTIALKMLSDTRHVSRRGGRALSCAIRSRT